MGAIISAKLSAERARRRSMAIDKQIEEDSKQLRREHTALLLGVPGSGKSTMLRQMKIQQNGYTPAELAEFRPVVYTNLVDATKTIVLTMKDTDTDFVEEINRKHAMQILEYEVESDSLFRLAPDIANAINSLWKDPTTATVIEQCSDPDLMESASYFLSHMQRISQSDYVPTEMDVLKATVKTAGMVEARFKLGSLTISVFDVDSSWQRSEIRKWIHWFEGVTSIIFCAALSDYDQVLSEEKAKTRMAESLVMFESVVNSRWFSRTSVVLFFTKVDVFKAKLSDVPLEKYFPEYAGGSDVNKAAKYILWKYTEANRAQLMVYPHLTDEKDTSKLRLFFVAVKETILQNALRESGIL